MITNTNEFLATVRHLSSTTEMLTAMYFDSKEQNDFTLFPLTAEGYFQHINELNAEIRTYLNTLPQKDTSVSASAVNAREAA